MHSHGEYRIFLKIKGGRMNDIILAQLKEIKESQERLEGQALKQWLSISEVKEYSSLSVSTIRRAILSGELKVSKKTGKLVFKRKWVDNWLNG